MTYREAGKRTAARLCDAGIEEAEAEARRLMEHVCGTDLGFFLLHAGEEIPEEEAESFFSLVDLRCRRIPLQHLTGEQEFMGLKFLVNEDVLIPRPETELLVEAAVRLAGEREPLRILDLCTGSGCIAVSLKSLCPRAQVYGSDISSEALKTAARNAAENNVKINWINADLFEPVKAQSGMHFGMFDMIVCNPPYIPTAVIDTLMPEVRDHDPRLALDGGEDGLYFYRRILDGCGEHLFPGGRILFETGSEQGNEVSALLREHGYINIEVMKDLAGLDRIAAGEKPDTERRTGHV